MAAEHEVVVRPLGRPGDLGWVVMAHGELYEREFGWDADFEALVARIVADHTRATGAGPRAAWIAEVDGVRAGCVFCAPGDEEGTAKLRLLLVDPAARGCGAGQALLDAAIALARRLGLREVTLEVRTDNDSAIRLYARNGFRPGKLLRGYYPDGTDARRMSFKTSCGRPE